MKNPNVEYVHDIDLVCGSCGQEAAVNPSNGLCEECDDPYTPIKEKRIVKVHGDRRSGIFEVELLDRYTGPDIEEDEIVHQALITIENRGNSYNLPVGGFVYVIAYDEINEDGCWGTIDPFINEVKEEEDHETWTDPAGGVHSWDDDPVKMYE